MPTVKSTSITALDATPTSIPTSGQGSKGYLNVTDDFVTATGTSSGASQAGQIILRMCRIPATAKVKAVYVGGTAMTNGSWDVGLYYSDATNDGTPASQQGTLVPGAQAFFGSAISFASAVNRTDVTNESGTYTNLLRLTPIALATNGTTQLTTLSTSQLGGFLDVCLTNTNTVQVSGSVGCEVRWTN